MGYDLNLWWSQRCKREHAWQKARKTVFYEKGNSRGCSTSTSGSRSENHLCLFVEWHLPRLLLQHNSCFKLLSLVKLSLRVTLLGSLGYSAAGADWNNVFEETTELFSEKMCWGVSCDACRKTLKSYFGPWRERVHDSVTDGTVVLPCLCSDCFSSLALLAVVALRFHWGRNQSMQKLLALVPSKGAEYSLFPALGQWGCCRADWVGLPKRIYKVLPLS